MADDTQPLTQMIKILKPLTTEERHRHFNAAMTYLGDLGETPTSPSHIGAIHNGGGGHHLSGAAGRMQQHNIPADQVERVFHFHEDGSFGIIAVPGKEKPERALNTYALVGLGTFLATGKLDFTDTAARESCKLHGCYDPKHHARTLKAKLTAFIAKGDDWSLTIPGIKDTAAIVKAVADSAGK